MHLASSTTVFLRSSVSALLTFFFPPPRGVHARIDSLWTKSGRNVCTESSIYTYTNGLIDGKLRETALSAADRHREKRYRGDNETTTRNRYVITRFGCARGVCARVHRLRLDECLTGRWRDEPERVSPSETDRRNNGWHSGPVDSLSLRTRPGRVVFVVERRSHRAPLSSPRRYRVINVITSAGNATLIRRIIVRIPP